MGKKLKKLQLSRESVRDLTNGDLRGIGGGDALPNPRLEVRPLRGSLLLGCPRVPDFTGVLTCRCPTGWISC